MAKDLPYFKFNASEYLNGDITLEDFYNQGVFINVCAYYWFKSGCLTLPEIKRRIKPKASALATLIERGMIKVDDDGTVRITFLDEQLDERKQLSKKNSINGKTGGAPIGNKNAQKNKPETSDEQPKTSNIEERREEKRREEESERENHTQLPDKKEIWEELVTDRLWVENMNKTHPGRDLKKAFDECWNYHSVKPSPPVHGWEWKQKLNTWLIKDQQNFNVNGTSNKQQQHTRKLAESVIEAYSDVLGGGEMGRSNEAPPVND